MRKNLFWLDDEEWERIERLLPTDVRGKERVDDRRVISGIVHAKEATMRKKKPVHALIDQVRITRDGNDAIIDYADSEISRNLVRHYAVSAAGG
jgi:transposase